MEVSVVRLSRPLLLAIDTHKDRNYFQTIYGYVIKEQDCINPVYVKDYVGYLAGLHCISNGDNYFTISYDLRGVPDWADKSGKVHIKQDAWIRALQEKCMKKLNLTYDIFNVDLDEDELNTVINEESLVVDETFYYDLRRYQPEEEQPLWEDDELPF